MCGYFVFACRVVYALGTCDIVAILDVWTAYSIVAGRGLFVFTAASNSNLHVLQCSISEQCIIAFVYLQDRAEVSEHTSTKDDCKLATCNREKPARHREAHLSSTIDFCACRTGSEQYTKCACRTGGCEAFLAAPETKPTREV